MNEQNLPDIHKCKSYYDIPFDHYAIAMFHPITTEYKNIRAYAKNFVDALIKSDINYILIYPNNDLGSKEVLQEFERLKGLDRIKIFPYGISDINSKMQMKSMVKHGYTQTGGSTVNINESFKNNKYKIYEAEFKIGDEILKFKKNNIAIKIDVEGHELNVLKGIQDLLKSNNCIIQIEIFKENFNLVNSFLLEKNFILVDQFRERANYFYSNYSYIVD